METLNLAYYSGFPSNWKVKENLEKVVRKSLGWFRFQNVSESLNIFLMLIIWNQQIVTWNMSWLSLLCIKIFSCKIQKCSGTFDSRSAWSGKVMELFSDFWWEPCYQFMAFIKITQIIDSVMKVTQPEQAGKLETDMSLPKVSIVSILDLLHQPFFSDIFAEKPETRPGLNNYYYRIWTLPLGKAKYVFIVLQMSVIILLNVMKLIRILWFDRCWAILVGIPVGC